MASLSLPRVLQLKKNSVDAEREQFEKFQTLAIQKAINSVETPVKEKHVRSTIIGTYQEQSAITYWMVAVRLPLQDNRIVAWKFCHVTHKLLREGHPACLDDSQRHVGMIENLGKLWVHLREGYGKLVAVYCRLLAVKLQFHARNPRFPGNMSLSSDELDAIAENDVNNYFQICVELFDYMDEILNLQSAVFDSLGNARANSMTASGQCRLAALIPCAQDSSHIYDCNVRLLFRLHAALPNDTLQGHRDRFRGQFKKLSQFYKHASSLQYYRNLLSLPVLPSEPPNFLLQSDFGTYVTPVVSIPEPSADETDAVGALIDTSDTVSQVTSQDLEAFDTRTTPSPQPDPVLERDRLIDHLQNELKRMRSEVHQMVQERNSLMSSMKEHCTRLETQLQVAKLEIDEERQKAELISAETPEIKQKLLSVEERARLTDEKFQKLKGAYTQLREEHIALIRQKAEVDKKSAALRAAAAQHESAKMALQQQLNGKIKDVELLQQSASSSEEVEAYKNELAALRSDLEKSRQKELELESLKASFEALEIEHKTAATESQEKLNVGKNELEEVRTNLESIKQEKEERESELSRVKEELVALIDKSGEEFNKAVNEKEAAIQEIAALKEQFVQEKQEHVNRANDLQEELERMSLKLTDLEVHLKNESEKWMSLITEKNQLSDSLLVEKDKEINEALDKVAELQKVCDSYKTKYESRIKSQQNEIDVLHDKIKTLMENIAERDKDYADEKQSLLDKINNLSNEKELLQKEVSENEIKIEYLTQNITELTVKLDKQIKIFQESHQHSTENINQLQEIINQYKENIIVLETKVTESHAVENNLNKDIEKFSAKVHELETAIIDKDSLIKLLNLDVDKINRSAESKITGFEAKKIELEDQISILNKSIKEIMSAKDEAVRYLEESVSSFETNNKNLQTELAKLEDHLIEREAELEICKNELLTLKDEYEAILRSNNDNIGIKNKELRMLNEEIIKITKEKVELVKEMESLSLNLGTENQVLEAKVKNLEKECEALKTELKNTQTRKQEIIDNLNDEVKKLSSFYDQMREAKEQEIHILSAKIEERTISFNNQAYERDNLIRQATNSIEELKVQLDDLKIMKDNEIRELESVISEKEGQNKMLEGRLVHVEKEKLIAECELQDLLQHNTALEESVTVLKKQLEDAQRQVEISRSSFLSSVGGAAAELASAAIASLDRSGADSSQAGALLAAQAFRDLAQSTQVKGSEESLSRSAVLAAHNAAQLSAYVTEVANIATDAAFTEKLQSDCRTMLTSTLQCMESLKSGVIDPCAYQLSEKVSAISSAANRAAVTHGDVTSVDAQLADMDSAIEDAAKQIEELLKNSRAADTGIKLEVNGTILDACTTLMAAVRELVQHSRSLQRELGDVTTRLKLYRKNPQWSDGLISAAKAVVFAAKLLVSSADEAVSGSGRLEGVSAAAHEVAGATAQLVSASRARAPPAAPALHALTAASRAVASATGALVAAVRQGAARAQQHEALDTSKLTLTATRILEMESRVRALELEAALEAERARLAALRTRHYHLEQGDENGAITNGNST